ncbi:MAG: hypothetical protein HKN29_16655, partial [Rhodothermales bacterium]|nr:hypothetical protein [Rhodothermales bacterium]
MNAEQEKHLTRFVARLEKRIRTLEATSLRYSRFRLSLFLLGAVTTTLAFDRMEAGSGWLILLGFIGMFVVVTRMHDRIHASLRRHRVYKAIKQRHLARIHRDWKGLGPGFDELAPEGHPFAADLDLLGPRSLHHLLDTSFSTGGRARLAAWLTARVPDPAMARSRQTLVKELVPKSAFRDRIALLSQVSGSPGSETRFDGVVLTEWLERRRDDERIRPLLRMLWGLAGLNVLFVTTHVAGLTGPWWAFSLTAYAALYVLNGRMYADLFDEAEFLHTQLERFRPVVGRLESYRFSDGSALGRHLAPFRDDERPSVHLARATRLAMAASAQKSEILRLAANILVPWDLYFTYRLAREKESLRTLLPRWLETVYDLEAAGSLATYADLNPTATFPDIHEAAASPLLVASGLTHPLLSSAEAVRNDLKYEATPSIT